MSRTGFARRNAILPVPTVVMHTLESWVHSPIGGPSPRISVAERLSDEGDVAPRFTTPYDRDSSRSRPAYSGSDLETRNAALTIALLLSASPRAATHECHSASHPASHSAVDQSGTRVGLGMPGDDFVESPRRSRLDGRAGWGFHESHWDYRGWASSLLLVYVTADGARCGDRNNRCGASLKPAVFPMERHVDSGRGANCPGDRRTVQKLLHHLHSRWSATVPLAGGEHDCSLRAEC